MSVSLSPLFNGFQSFLASGLPNNGGFIYTYSAGTTTPLATYTTVSGGVANSNPIILSADGRPPQEIWMTDGSAYKFFITDALGVGLPNSTFDNITTFSVGLAGISGASLIGYGPLTLDTILLNQINAVRTSIAALRLIDKSKFTQAFITGYYAAGDGGGGAYYYDATDTATADNGGTIIVAADGGRWKLVYGTGGVSIKQFGAKCDNVTDDTTAINASATAARAKGFSLFVNEGSALVSATLDFSLMTVYGNKEKSKIQSTAAQFDVIKTTGNSTLRDFYVHGGWDGATAGQTGCGIRIYANPPTTFAYDVHIEGVKLQFIKQTGIKFEVSGYSRVRSQKINACGLHGIHIQGVSATLAATTVTIDGMGTSSDCPNGFGLLVEEAISINVDGLITENTKGVSAAGNDNRSINLNAVYQEGTVGGLFFSSSGAGIGLTITNCFSGGAKIPELPNWANLTFYGNSNLTESSAPGQVNGGKVLQVTSVETVVTASGDFTLGSLSLPPGSYMLYANMQTLNAGSGVLTRAAINITGNAAASGYNNATNTNYGIGCDAQNYNPGGNADLRCNAITNYSNSGNANLAVFLRGNLAITSGSVAYKGTLTAVKIS